MPAMPAHYYFGIIEWLEKLSKDGVKDINDVTDGFVKIGVDQDSNITIIITRGNKAVYSELVSFAEQRSLASSITHNLPQYGDCQITYTPTPSLEPYLEAIKRAEAATRRNEKGFVAIDNHIVRIEANETGGVTITVTRNFNELYNALRDIAMDRSRTGVITQSTPVFSDQKISYGPK